MNSGGFSSGLRNPWVNLWQFLFRTFEWFICHVLLGRSNSLLWCGCVFGITGSLHHTDSGSKRQPSKAGGPHPWCFSGVGFEQVAMVLLYGVQWLGGKIGLISADENYGWIIGEDSSSYDTSRLISRTDGKKHDTRIFMYLSSWLLMPDSVIRSILYELNDPSSTGGLCMSSYVSWFYSILVCQRCWQRIFDIFISSISISMPDAAKKMAQVW